MVQRPGYFAPTNSQRVSIGSVPNSNNTLTAFRQGDVVQAMMTQLREKESELTRLSKHRQALLEQYTISEQANLQLQNKISSNNEVMAKKDAKIAMLEEGSSKHLADNNSRFKRVIQERDDELSRLKSIVEEFKARIDEYEHSRQPSKLEEEVTKVKCDLVIARGEILTSYDTIEQLEKKVKSKEWMIKTLKEENDQHRSRETELLSQINKLREGIQTYETKFTGRGVDVPMLLAKLRDYGARTKDLEGQVRRLTNNKLNELVVRSTLGPRRETEVGRTHPMSPREPNSPRSPISPCKENSPSSPNLPIKPNSPHSCNSHRSGEDVDEVLTSNTFTVANENTFIDATENSCTVATENTFTVESYSRGTYETDDQSFISNGGVFDQFISDVEVGIETLKVERLCCSHRSSNVGTTPRSRAYHPSPGK